MSDTRHKRNNSSFGLPIIHSSEPTQHNRGTDYSFPDCDLVTAVAKLSLDGRPIPVIIDTSNPLSMINEQLLTLHAPHALTRRVPWGDHVVFNWHDRATDILDQYVLLDFWFEGSRFGDPAIAHFKRRVHISANPDVGILIGVDILTREKLVLDFGDNQAFIQSCPHFRFPIGTTGSNWEVPRPQITLPLRQVDPDVESTHSNWTASNRRIDRFVRYVREKLPSRQIRWPWRSRSRYSRVQLYISKRQNGSRRASAPRL
jgi:hypothetical protein